MTAINLKQILFCLISVLILLQCRKHGIEVHTISVDEIENNAVLEDVFTDFENLNFHGFPEDIILGNIEKLYKVNGHIVVWDDLQNSIFIFDENGSYLSIIDSYGKSSNEYVDIEDFTVNEKNGTILLLDRAFFFLEYNLKGQFLRKEKLPTSASRIVVDHNGVIVFQSFPKDENLDCVFWVMNNALEKECLHHGNIEFVRPVFGSHFSISKNRRSKDIDILFATSRFVYGLKNGELYPKYELVSTNPNLLPECKSDEELIRQSDLTSSNEKFSLQTGEILNIKEWTLYRYYHSGVGMEYLFYNWEQKKLFSSLNIESLSALNLKILGEIDQKIALDFDLIEEDQFNNLPIKNFQLPYNNEVNVLLGCLK